MTDEERREAERLDYAAVKDLWQRGGGESGTRLENYTQGYVAGRESLRATMPEWEVRARLKKLEGKYAEGRAMWERTIDAERARSARLIEALKMYADYREECDVAARAIVEYEASRD